MTWCVPVQLTLTWLCGVSLAAQMAGWNVLLVQAYLAIHEGTEMSLIWRFYVDERRLWRWQQLSVSRAVIAESASGYEMYEACIANATEQGYVFALAKTKPRAETPAKHRR
jgi:hypothetical protein